MQKHQKTQYMLTPPCILHIGHRPNNYEEVISDMARNTHLGKRAESLLKYYAKSNNGFRPSAAQVEKCTGIASDKVYKVREELVIRAVINYKPTDYIRVQWNTIKILAGLPEPLPMRGMNYKFNSYRSSHDRKSELTIGQLMGKYGQKKGGKSGTVERFFDYLKSLRRSEYEAFSLGVLGMKPPPNK